MTPTLDAERPDAPPHIQSITVEGFKCFGEAQTLEIRPLTVLAGANSSGKSSIMQPLLLLKQTLESPTDMGPLRLSGPNVHFTEFRQFLARGRQPEDATAFDVEVALGLRSGVQAERVRLRFSRPDQSLLEPKLRMECSFGKYPIVVQEAGPLPPDFSVSNGHLPFMKFERAVRQKFFYLLQGQLILPAQNGGETVVPFSPINPTEPLPELIAETIHLAGWRGHPNRTYLRTAVDTPYQGQFHEYFASIIEHWELTADARHQRLQDELRRLNLANRVAVRRLNDAEVEVLVSRTLEGTGEMDWVNVADVGLGVSQVLPVLVALLTAKAGQFLYIEQPELHLHPRAQHLLGDLLVQAADRGVRIVVETHSDLLLRGIQTCVAQGRISPDKVGFNWFARDAQTGFSRITPADLDDCGRFGEWPEDFGDVSIETANDYLNAVEQRRSAARR